MPKEPDIRFHYSEVSETPVMSGRFTYVELVAHCERACEQDDAHPKVVEIYKQIIRWAATAELGDWMDAEFGYTYAVYCVRPIPG